MIFLLLMLIKKSALTSEIPQIFFSLKFLIWILWLVCTDNLWLCTFLLGIMSAMDRIRMIWLSMFNGTIVASLGAEMYKGWVMRLLIQIDLIWKCMLVCPAYLNHLLGCYRLQPATDSVSGNTYSFLFLSIYSMYFPI